MTHRRLRIATRGSPLALFQARRVAVLVQSGGAPEPEIVTVSTTGDERAEVPLSSLGGRGVFVREVQHAVLDGWCDLAVHSAKDLPPESSGGLCLAAVPEREDPRDALVGSMLDGLAPGAMVATGAVRRRAQLAALRPDLTFCELRGNIATRLGRVPERGAVVVALAALRRLGIQDRVAEVLPVSMMLPQVGQGALAVECRDSDEEARLLLASVEDTAARRCIDAERSFLRALGGSCDLPVGALALCGSGADRGVLGLEAVVASGDGRIVVRHCMKGDDPVALGSAMADFLRDNAGLGETLGAVAGF